MRKKSERDLREVARRLNKENLEPEGGGQREQEQSGEQQSGTQGWTEEENEEWIRKRYPGYLWDQKIGEGGTRYPLTEEISGRDWKYLPQSFLEPMVWFWNTAKWATGFVQQGRMRGTTWLQLVADFEALTGKEILTKRPRVGLVPPDMIGKARLFALASWRILQKRVSRRKAPQGKTN